MLSLLRRPLAMVAPMAVALTALAHTADAQRVLPADSVIRAVVSGRVDSGRNAGIVVGLIDADGSTRWMSYGRGPGSAAFDDHTLFEIGAITGTFTATLYADMVAKGIVRHNQPVAELLPPRTVVPSRAGRTITLWNLATHTAGLPQTPADVAPVDPTNPRAGFDEARLTAFLSRYTLPRDIGTAFEYSPLGMGLLGHALASRMGVPFEQLLADRVLRPLRLDETAITLTPEARTRLAPGHDSTGKPVEGGDHAALPGAGALHSSVHDLLRYLATNITPLGSPVAAALRYTQRLHFQTDVPTRAIGLGWQRIVSSSGDTLVTHGGVTAGYASFVGFDPRRRVAVVVLSNSANAVDDIGLGLLQGRAPPARPARVR